VSQCVLLSAAIVKGLWFRYGFGLGLVSQCVLLSAARVEGLGFMVYG
jgi:hypothetical protein